MTWEKAPKELQVWAVGRRAGVRRCRPGPRGYSDTRRKINLCLFKPLEQGFLLFAPKGIPKVSPCVKAPHFLAVPGTHHAFSCLRDSPPPPHGPILPPLPSVLFPLPPSPWPLFVLSMQRSFQEGQCLINPAKAVSLNPGMPKSRQSTSPSFVLFLFF